MALERDGNVYVLPLLDELPEVHLFSSDADATDTGYTFGRPLPATASSYGVVKRLVSFEGLSGDEEIYPTAAETNLRRALNYFHSGGSIRVYRNYPAVLSVWDPDTLDGYDDIVPADTGAAVDYPWFGASSFRRYTFKIEGVTEDAS